VSYNITIFPWWENSHVTGIKETTYHTSAYIIAKKTLHIIKACEIKTDKKEKCDNKKNSTKHIL